MGRVELCEAVARLQESLAAFTGQHGAGRRAWHRQTILPGLRGLLESARQVARRLDGAPELCGGVDFGPYPPLSEAAEAVTTRAARWLKACHAPGFWLNPRWDETATVRHNGKPVTVLVEGGDFGETLGELRDLSGVIDGAGRAMVAHWQRLDDLQAVQDAMAPCPEAMTNAVVAPRNDNESDGQRREREPAAGGFWSVPDIAKQYRLTEKQKGALQSRLRRWRTKNLGASTWREVQDGETGPRGSRFLYSLDAVRSMVQEVSE